MSGETLGEAILYLRTDDSALNAGVDTAEGKAVRLGGTFDQTSGKATALSGALVETGGAAQIGAAGMAQLERETIETGSAAAVTTPKIGAMSAEIVGVGIASRAASIAGGLLAGVLTGGISIAVGIAVGALTGLVGALFDVEDAAEAAKVGADGLADAQGVLGKVFDETSGKIKSQNELLLLNARLTAINLRKEAMTERQNAIDVSRDTQSVGIKDKVLGWLQRSGRDAGMSGTREGQANRAALLSIIDQVHNGTMTRDAALQMSEKQDFTGVSVSREEFQQAIIDSASSQAKLEIAAKIDKSLDEGSLDPSLRKPAKAARTRHPREPKDRSAQIEEAQARELERLGQEETRARLDLTDNIDDRAALQMELLGQERDARIREIEQDKDLSDAQKQARLAYIEKLYGKPGAGVGPNGEIVVGSDTGLYGDKIMRDVRDREIGLANDALGRQADALSAQASVTDNLHARDALEKKALELQQQIQRNLLEQAIANGDVADADRARADLAKQQAAAMEGLSRSQDGPLKAYARRLDASNDNLDYEIEGYVVDELQSVRDSLHESIRKVTGTDDPLINGLIQMFVEQVFIRPLAQQLAQLSSAGGSIGGGGLFGSILSGLFGAAGAIGGGGGAGVLGSGADVGSIATDIQFGGFRAGGGAIEPGKAYAVNEYSTAPGIFMPLMPGVIQPPSAGYAMPDGSAQAGGRAPVYLSVEVNGARGNAEIREMVSQGVQEGIAGYDQIVVDRVQDGIRRRG